MTNTAQFAPAVGSLIPHRTLENVEIARHGMNLETWRADHGVVDEKGRKVGGRVTIEPQGIAQFSVRIQAMRDGVVFGACRRAHLCTNIEHAHDVATRKVIAQRKAFRAKYKPAVAS